MFLPWSKQPSARTPTTTPSQLPTSNNQRLSPLDIPEVLERVFSHLDRHSLAFAAPLVCHQWYTTSKRFLCVVANLDGTLNKKRRAANLAAVPFATRVIVGLIDHRCTSVPAETERLRPLFPGKLRSGQPPQHHSDAGTTSGEGVKAGPDTAPLQELVLWRWFADMQILLSIFPSSTALTFLKLHNDWHTYLRLDLGAIFQAYPNLTSLELSTSAIGNYIILEPGSTYFPAETVPSPQIPERLHLQTLILQDVTISQSTLQSVLNAASSTLRHLHLWTIKTIIRHPFYDIPTTYANSFDLSGFIDFLLALSLRLESFSFSVFGPREQEILTHLMAVRDILNGFGSKVQAWGFSIPFTQILAREPNRITSLTLFDVYGTSDTVGAYTPILHQFLCNSPHLLHLYAWDLSFNPKPMDVYSYLNGHEQIWACSRLQTLCLSFTCPLDNSWECGRHSRVVFGYLARVCPRLRDLELGIRRRMSLELEDGWVILSRLQFLERVSFWPSHGTSRRKAMDSLWGVVHPSVMDQTWQWYTIKKWKARLERDAIEIRARKDQVCGPDPPGFEENESWPWKRFKYLGTLVDVTMALEDLAKDPGLENGWPKLYSVRIWYREGYEQGYDRRVIESRMPARIVDRARIVNFPWAK